MPKIIHSVLLSVLLGVSLPVWSEESFDRFADALVTDRPDAAEASVTVGKLRFQVETSVAFSHDHDAGVTSRTYGMPTLLRFGVIDPLELRVEGELVSIQTETGATTQRGVPDMAFGLKAHAFDQKGVRPSFGVLAHVGAPTGTDALSSNALEPSFKVLADWELPADFSLGTNYGFDIPARDIAGDKFARFLYAAALNHPTPFLKERMRVFIEAAGAVPFKKGKTMEHTFDAGLALFLTPDIQLDSFVAIGLNAASAGVQTGLGFSWRL